MAITKEKKVEIISSLTDVIKKSLSLVFVNFHGLSVSNTTALRSKLREDSVGYMVAKKTLVKKVLGDSKIDGDIPVLSGELALAYGEDLITPAREVYEFQKAHKGNITILGGVFEGVYKNKEEMTEIASIPTPIVLRGMFVNVINSPIQGLVVALNAIAEKRA